MDKLIGKDSGTRARTVTCAVTTVLQFLTVFNVIHFSDAQVDATIKLAVMIVNLIAWMVGFYFNECHTDENCKYTGIMRAKGVTPEQKGSDEVMSDD